MAKFDANIYLNTIVNQASLNKAAASIQKVTQAAKLIQPINLFAPGSGAGADKIRTSLAEIDKVVKNINAGNKGPGKLSTTYAGASQQASVLLDVLSNVNLKTKQAQTQIKQYADAYVAANKQAQAQEELLDNIIRKAKGITQTRLEERKAIKSLETRKRREEYLTKEKEKQLAIERKAAREAERRAKAAERSANAAKKERNRLADAIQGATLGGGFPLLFGGPSFSALGGAIGGGVAGAFGGQQASFAGGIAGSVIGAAIDALTQKATKLGQALLKPTTNIETLISSLGIAGTRLNSTIQSLRDLGFESVAAAVAVDSLEEKYGKDTVNALRGLGKEFTEFQNAMQTLGVRIAALVAGPLGGLLNLLAKAAGSAGNAGALGQLSQNLSSENREKFNKRLNELTNGAGISGTISDQTLQTLISEFDPVAVEKAAEAAKKRAEAEKIISDELERQIAVATSAARVESVRLTARRDTFASLRSDLAIQKEKANLARILLNLENETEAVKLRQLNLDRELSAQAVKRLEAARQNAIIEAQRQITRDVSSQNQSAAQAYSESLAITQQIYDLSQSQAVSYQQQQDLLKEQSTIQMALLAERRQMELLGVTELELIDAINKKYFQLEEQEKRRLALQQERLRQEEVMRQYRAQEVIDSRELAKLEAERSASLQIRDMDFERDFELTGEGFGFFGDSEIFKDKRLEETAAKLEGYNEQIGKLQARIKKLNAEGVDPDVIKPLTDNLDNLIAVRDQFQKLQPAIDAAAIAQARFNDAFNLLNPVMQNIVNNLAEVVKGTMSVEEAFASMLDNIGKMLAQKGAEMIATYIAIGLARIFAGIDPSTSKLTVRDASMLSLLQGAEGRSTGGPVGADRPYMVGENGPELFVPRTSGTVVNNEDTRSALGRYNSGSNDMVVNYSPNIQSTTINGQEYVTVEQMNIAVSRGMETAAKKGAQGGFVRTMSSLKNNRSNRKTIGL